MNIVLDFKFMIFIPNLTLTFIINNEDAILDSLILK